MASKQVLISGGTSGIGQAIARAFAADGHQVVATGVSEAEVEAARSEQANDSIRYEILDVRSSEQIAGLIASLSQLNVLVNCAGLIRRGGAEHDPVAFAEVLDVNLTGTMRLCTAARPLLKESQGCVLNTASMLSFFGSGVAPAYSASKGGVAQLTKSLAIAWAADGIRVNAIAPGRIETPLTEPLTSDPTRRQTIIDRTPLARWGRPEDVAGAALFLCSPAAAFITGVILPVDGGYSIA
ncbi:MAG: SDR family oxidoreductase [Planctomycetales bacterium]|nr:SDR family oxidoreductase [Planctomycetales bacterium]